MRYVQTVVPEAPLERNDAGGLYPAGEGWFVVNARETQWFDTTPLGFYAPFEGENARFEQLGINIGILRPGEVGGMYHGEDAQEDFLVLEGECLLIVEGQERTLRRWDFFHCPPWTEHGFVGIGDGPFVVLAVGARRKGRGIVYPVDETALKHDAGVSKETTEPSEAYARFSEPKAVPCPGEFPG
jgi:uncharacterized cupin superfamily protein